MRIHAPIHKQSTQIGDIDIISFDTTNWGKHRQSHETDLSEKRERKEHKVEG